MTNVPDLVEGSEGKDSEDEDDVDEDGPRESVDLS